jgi:hypothetical protein
MSKNSIKPKVMMIWSEQTDKLKRKLESFIECGLCIEKSKIDEMFVNLQNKSSLVGHDSH